MAWDFPLLLAVAPLLGIVVWALARLARARRIRHASAWDAATGAAAAATGRGGPWLLGLAALAAGVALAGPRGGRGEVTSETRALSLVFAVDISRSMLAEDAPPNRLQRAVREVRRLVQDLPGDRMGLIAFAGRSYILSPLTVDGGAISLFLDDLSPDLVSQGGTGLAAVLAQGRQLLSASSESSDRVLVVFTDGEAHDSLPAILGEARNLAKSGIHLVLVAEGQTTPARIPVRDSAGVLVEYQKDADGRVIETWRRDDVLGAIADAAEGTVVSAQLSDQAGTVRDLVAVFKRNPTRSTSTATLLPLSWIPLLLALALLAWQTVARRTAALIGLATLCLLRPAAAQHPARGELELKAGRPSEAVRAFMAEAAAGAASDTAYYNAGTAALAAGEADVARKALAEAAKSRDPGLRYRALYNLGVLSLQESRADSGHRQAKLEEAAQYLQDALLLQPGSARAKWNLELARHRQPPPPPSSSGKSPPPPGGSGAPPPPAGNESRNLSTNQAEQVLSSVQREERNVRARHLGRTRNEDPRIKDW